MVEEYIIKKVDALQVLDSRGDPTVEAVVITKGGGIGRAISPAGASKGTREAFELRDGDAKLFRGKSVLKAVENIIHYIGPAIQGLDSRLQREIDRIMIGLDGTPNKSRLGANAILAVSVAVAKAAADTAKLPLFEYLGGKRSCILPIPMLNIINGGAHAGNDLSIQEFMIVPIGFDRFSDALRASVEVYKELRSYLKEKYGPQSVNVGDEGGYAPPMRRTEEALNSLLEAIKRAGYTVGDNFLISIDAAASQFFDKSKNRYRIDGLELDRDQLIEYWIRLVEEYPILSIEDPFNEEDFDAFAILRKNLQKRVIIVGDDLTVTSIHELRRAYEKGSVDGVIVKMNQVGTLTETLDFIEMAKRLGIATIVSHRSGESEDTTIAHLAVAVGGPFIKTGAPARSERTAKYNELLRIENYLAGSAIYAAKLYSFK